MYIIRIVNKNGFYITTYGVLQGYILGPILYVTDKTK